MDIGSIGFNYSHGSEFIMDRPEGPGCWLFLLIKTTAKFIINGIEHQAKENSCILISPKTPVKYMALDKTYKDDWFYFWKGDNMEEEYFKSLGIPVNELVHLGNIEELSQIIHIMTFEHYSVDTHHQEIEDLYTKILFLKVSRIIKTANYISSKSFIEKNASLSHIRTNIYIMPDRVENIDALARQVGMSRSGFQHLYKKMFGVSVITDIIKGRLERAKQLLSSTNMTLEEISVKCGYSNVYGFMRQFKKYCGKTPTEYRKSL